MIWGERRRIGGREEGRGGGNKRREVCKKQTVVVVREGGRGDKGREVAGEAHWEGGGWEGAFEGLRSPRGSERRGNPCPCLLRNVIVRYPDGQILETILMSGRVCEVSFAFSDISFQLSPLPSGYLQQLEIHTVQSIEESKGRLVVGPIFGLFGPTTFFGSFGIFTGQCALAVRVHFNNR